jgi:hypothetical protein
VNGSQSKFLIGTWPISRIRPDVPLFSLGQDRTAIGKLLALGTGLGTTAETQIDAGKITCEIDDKNRIEEQFISLQAFHRIHGGRIQGTTTGE